MLALRELLHENVGGTDYQESIKPGGYTFNALYLDAVNKRVILFETGSCKVRCDEAIADLPDDPSVFVVTPRPISLDMVWQEVDGAASYSVTYTVGLKGEWDVVISSVESTNNLRHSVKKLDPGSTYTLIFNYSTTEESPSLLVGSSTHTTLDNLSENYDRSRFSHDDGDGTFDLTSLNAVSLAPL